jgi:hypothetical protein
VQNAYCCGAEGFFAMRRIDAVAFADSIVDAALRTHARDVAIADSLNRVRAAERRREAEERAAVDKRPPRAAMIAIEGNDGSTPGDHLLVGQRSRLIARVYDARPANREEGGLSGVSLAWSSTDSSVLGVDSIGRVEARAPGRAYAVARIRAIASVARFADGVSDSMPFVVTVDTAGLGRLRYTTVVAAPMGESTCALRTDGAVTCVRPVPGAFLEDDSSHLTIVDLPREQRVLQLAAGFDFACALLESGVAWCWGRNDDGELADGDTASRSEPRAVLGDLRFRRIVAGRTHVCAISVDGALYCWGMMLNSRVARSATDRCSVPVERMAARQIVVERPRCARRPVPALDEYLVRDVAVGDDHTCVIASPARRGARAELLCWGSIYNIELQSREPVRMRMPSELLVSLVSGSQHLCGLTQSGEAWCWGRNWLGQGGSRTTGAGSRQPQRVDTSIRFGALTAGSEHTCGVTLDGRAWCWGDNRSGQLGHGDVEASGIKVSPVAGDLRFRSIAAGASHTCAVSVEGGLWCWGSGLAFRHTASGLHDQPEPFAVAGWSHAP